MNSSTELSNWSKEEILKRVLELENELIEFQESSKELENVLEEELQNLETENDKLRRQDEVKGKTISHLNGTIKQMKLEMNEISDKYNDDKMSLDNEIRTLKQRLVEVEITNDSMESNDRLISNKLDGINQFNMELLEKIALLENDLHLEKKQNTEKSLHIINYENTINGLRQRLQVLEKNPGNDDELEVDVSVLSMRDMLKAGPPVSPHVNKVNMRKSDSLQKLHELSMKSEGFSSKVRNLRRDSLYMKSPMKSPSTTQLSNHLHTAKSRTGTKTVKKEGDPIALEKSKTSKNLTNMLYKESGTLDTIVASPVNSQRPMKSREDSKQQKKKKPKRSNLLGTWFH